MAIESKEIFKNCILLNVRSFFPCDFRRPFRRFTVSQVALTQPGLEFHTYRVTLPVLLQLDVNSSGTHTHWYLVTVPS